MISRLSELRAGFLRGRTHVRDLARAQRRRQTRRLPPDLVSDQDSRTESIQISPSLVRKTVLAQTSTMVPIYDSDLDIPLQTLGLNILLMHVAYASDHAFCFAFASPGATLVLTLQSHRLEPPRTLPQSLDPEHKVSGIGRTVLVRQGQGTLQIDTDITPIQNSIGDVELVWDQSRLVIQDSVSVRFTMDLTNTNALDPRVQVEIETPGAVFSQVLIDSARFLLLESKPIF